MLINISTTASVASTPSTPSTVSSTATETKESTSSAGGMTVNMHADSNGAAGVGGGGQASSLSKESDTVKELKKQIEQLQKQLQAQQQALQKAQSSNQSAEAKAAAVAAAQMQIAGTAAALQTVTSALLQAVIDEGNSTSGSMVSTTA
ncbi:MULTISPECIES: hypothetical protein [unclassified Pseudomonas]|uniref:hypothetical protein n=1 Tax=unclassified Pseudomonas TaxID=196821 RepID=UPI00160D2A70|nr:MULTISPECIES: hypothetical protein [unclassified Pseudomonas]MBB6286391.1 putative phage infection (PIP) family protein YhgE [Pseudomonas sp. SJZ073]MBB6311684.1 putative phage infection (PIP) family protein YhgE [Pseudomonas sp. JAI120]